MISSDPNFYTLKTLKSPNPDFSRVNLKDKAYNFTGTIFIGTQMLGADFSSSINPITSLPINPALFVNAVMRNVNATGAKFTGANMSSLNTNGTPTIFAEANFDRANLKGANLSGDNSSIDPATGAIISQGSAVDLSGASLQNANLSSANMTAAILKGADLSGSNLNGANLGSVILYDTNMTGTDLRHSNFTDGFIGGNTKFDLALLDSVSSIDMRMGTTGNLSFKGASMVDFRMESTSLNRADFSAYIDVNGTVTQTNLTNARLTSSVLTEAEFDQTIATNANFSDAKLTNAILAQADFTNANLKLVDLSGATVKGSNLNNIKAQITNLTGAKFTSDLRDPLNPVNTSMVGADLKEARANGTVDGIFANDTLFQGVSLNEANLELSSFVDTKFENSDLTNLVSGVGFSATETVFENVDFSGSTFVNASLRDVKFVGTLTGLNLNGFTTLQNLDFSEVTQLVNVTGLPANVNLPAGV